MLKKKLLMKGLIQPIQGVCEKFIANILLTGKKMYFALRWEIRHRYNINFYTFIQHCPGHPMKSDKTRK